MLPPTPIEATKGLLHQTSGGKHTAPFGRKTYIELLRTPHTSVGYL